MTSIEQLPNIIIFIPDEMRGDTVSLGKAHNSVIKTPNIDDLANDGAAFTKCFTVNPICVPSRCCTFTGQYVHSNSHRSLYQLLEHHEENLFKFLKKKGYEVIWIGRNDLFSKKTIKESVTKRIRAVPSTINAKDFISSIKTNPFPKEHPFRKSFYFGERTPEQANDSDFSIINKALKYLESKPSKPFCLYLAMNFPHPPYTVEEPYFSMHDRKEVPAPFPSKLDDKPEFMQIIHERYGLNKLSDDDFREIVATYYGMISRIDDQFGQIVKKLKEIGEYENSAIFFFADHGDYAGNYGLTEKWPNAFQDCLVNIPLVIKIPGIKPEKKIYDNLVQSIDIFPTIMEIAKIKTPYTHFGKNLIPLLTGEKIELRDAVFAEGGYNIREPQCFEIQVKNPDIPLIGIYYDKTNIALEKPSTVARSVMIRTAEWKLILRNGIKEELYDLIKDPSELNNLINDNVYSKIILELKEKLLRWYLNTSDNANWKRLRHP
ncbi:MAG: sulfatase-like hydrolase/transferase [Promethearchaeota archaeon]